MAEYLSVISIPPNPISWALKYKELRYEILLGSGFGMNFVGFLVTLNVKFCEPAHSGLTVVLTGRTPNENSLLAV